MDGRPDDEGDLGLCVAHHRSHGGMDILFEFSPTGLAPGAHSHDVTME